MRMTYRQNLRLIAVVNVVAANQAYDASFRDQHHVIPGCETHEAHNAKVAADFFASRGLRRTFKDGR